jgi:hypothetical protein
MTRYSIYKPIPTSVAHLLFSRGACCLSRSLPFRSRPANGTRAGADKIVTAGTSSYPIALKCSGNRFGNRPAFAMSLVRKVPVDSFCQGRILAKNIFLVPIRVHTLCPQGFFQRLNCHSLTIQGYPREYIREDISGQSQIHDRN